MLTKRPNQHNAEKLPEQTSVYLTFQYPDDEKENVEISMHEAAFLHGWLADILNPARGQ